MRSAAGKPRQDALDVGRRSAVAKTACTGMGEGDQVAFLVGVLFGLELEQDEAYILSFVVGIGCGFAQAHRRLGLPVQIPAGRAHRACPRCAGQDVDMDEVMRAPTPGIPLVRCRLCGFPIGDAF